MRTFKETKRKVLNRGVAPDAFLNELIDWANCAPGSIFATNANPNDIYSKTKEELGPWKDLRHRKAVMLEVMRVLAGFESSWNWKEGIDSTRKAADTALNAEAGAWQVSADSMAFGQDLKLLVIANVGNTNGRDFQDAMKSNHKLAMEYVARLMRHTAKHNGPLYKGTERRVIQAGLRGAEHSIYPWLSRESVAEFEGFLCAC